MIASIMLDTAVLFIHKTNICTSNKHNNEVLSSLLHVSAELHHLQEVYTPIFKPTKVQCGAWGSVVVKALRY
jgi:hypothetical protein